MSVEPRRSASDLSEPTYEKDFWDWWMKITREENWHGDTDETGAATYHTAPTEQPGPTPD
jgi:hypothetical protein